MTTENKDLIVGIHSIREALLNSERENKLLYITEEAYKKLRATLPSSARIEDYAFVERMNSGKLQAKAQQVYKDLGFNYNRVPGGMFLLANSLKYKSTAFLYELIESGPRKFIVLDQVTDSHNAGAIFRTAAFYGVDGVIHSFKGSFGGSPGFFRNASGGAEHVHSISVPKLGQCISKMLEKGVQCIGITEEGEESVAPTGESICLVLGAEETGISHSIKRILDSKMRLNPAGKIQTLNVSVATAIAMEKLLGH